LAREEVETQANATPSPRPVVADGADDEELGGDPPCWAHLFWKNEDGEGTE